MDLTISSRVKVPGLPEAVEDSENTCTNIVTALSG